MTKDPSEQGLHQCESWEDGRVGREEGRGKEESERGRERDERKVIQSVHQQRVLYQPVEMMLDHGILLVVLNKFRDALYSLTPHTVACLIHMFIHLKNSHNHDHMYDKYYYGGRNKTISMLCQSFVAMNATIPLQDLWHSYYTYNVMYA